ncbi:MAG: molecular chaperone HtpG [Gammaproteobacteria bacterium]|nr:molecular chaperone HtpG [Gammaproteobacteria bacterium]
MTAEVHKETLDFQAEARQLLRLMIHSLYSNKEIFLRELISNASDACDKLRFEALTDEALFEGESGLRVRVSCDRQARTLTVTDNGIGMSRQEVIDHIGTIAKSGTRQFFESLTGDQAGDLRLIGQFGVGFYSAFIVAERVTLTTRRAGLGPEHGVRWESTGEGSYTLETVPCEHRGTEIVLHLRADEDEFLDGHRLREIIRRYSDSVSLPVEMPVEMPAETPTADEGGAGEWETVNRAAALWARPRKEITAEEYDEFYRHVAHDFEAPLAHVHTQIEGTQSYIALLYLPKRAPFDLWDRERGHGIKLYVRRVFIMEDTERLMPNYLRFVRGVVDSDDLPLNVSREILQHNRQLDVIRGASVKKVLGLLKDMAEGEPEKYQAFWAEFGRVMKEGPAEDYANREQIAKLLRFATTHGESGAQDISLDDYVGRMKEGQDRIYYITAESPLAARNSPHLEIFRKKGIEVLLLSERVDEWMLTGLTEYAGKPLQSVAKGELSLGGLEDAEEKRDLDVVTEEFKGLAERMGTTLAGKVKEVRVTHRLTDSPSCLVVDQDDMGMSLRKLLEATGQKIPANPPILEINPEHPLVKTLKREQDGVRFDDWAHLLFEQAMLSEGGQLEDPAAFVRRMNALLLAPAG